MSTAVQKGPDEVYCSECGEVIKTEAEICPECGVRQSSDSAETQESYGLVFAFVDAWKRQKALRHVVNIALIFASFGTYLGLLAIEALIHYRNLNAGQIEPYRGEKNQQVWVIPINPDQYRSEEAEEQVSSPSTASATETPERRQQRETEPQRHQQTNTEVGHGASSTDWLDAPGGTEDRIRVENRSGDPIGATVGVRNADGTAFVESIELGANATEEWTDFPTDEPFEVGVDCAGETVAEQFEGGSEPSYEIEVTITDGGTAIENVSGSGTFTPDSATREAEPSGVERTEPAVSRDETQQSPPSDAAAQEEPSDGSNETGGGKILALGLVIMFVVGPAMSLVGGLPAFTNSIAWGAGILAILFGAYRIVVS